LKRHGFPNYTFRNRNWFFTMWQKLKLKFKEWRRKLLSPVNALFGSLKRRLQRSAQKVVATALAEHHVSRPSSNHPPAAAPSSQTFDKLLLGFLKAGVRKSEAHAAPQFQVVSVGADRLLAVHPLAGFLYLSTDDVNVIPHVALGQYQDRQTTAIQHEILPGDQVLHLGAEQGYHTLSLAHLAGKTGHVLAVEGNADRFRLLELNVRAHALEARVQCLNESALQGSLRDCLRTHKFVPTAVYLTEGVALPQVWLNELLEWMRQDSSLRVIAGAKQFTANSLPDWLPSHRVCGLPVLSAAA
jgi:precorrin-6B methylase 2